MRITYDESADAAYIALTDIKAGEAAIQLEVPLGERPAEMHLDFDENGKLLGIEIIGAMELIQSDLLANAERIG